MSWFAISAQFVVFFFSIDKVLMLSLSFAKPKTNFLFCKNYPQGIAPDVRTVLLFKLRLQFQSWTDLKRLWDIFCWSALRSGDTVTVTICWYQINIVGGSIHKLLAWQEPGTAMSISLLQWVMSLRSPYILYKHTFFGRICPQNWSTEKLLSMIFNCE